jgi:hypothetical protein
MVFGQMVATETGAVIGLDQLQPIGVELTERDPRVVQVVEHTEFHLASGSQARPSKMIRLFSILPSSRIAVG